MKLLEERKLWETRTPVLDSRDKKIIELLRGNARMPYTKIGKVARISKDQVRERIKRFLEANVIIDFLTIINYSLLGYKLYHVFIRFYPFLKKEFLIKKLNKNPYIISLGLLVGRYDLEIQIIAKNKKSAKDMLNKLLSVDNTKKEVFIIKEEKDYIIPRYFDLKNEKPIINKKVVSIDEKDKKILGCIANNARMSFVDIGVVTSCKEDTVRYRMKQLISKGVIVDFITRISRHRFKKINYILILKLKNQLNISDKRKLKSIEPIYLMMESADKRNIILYFSSEGYKGLKGTIESVKENLHSKIKKMDFATLLVQHKLNPFSKEICVQ